MEIISKITRMILVSILILGSYKSYAIRDESITAIYAFGDSYTDTGNALISDPAIFGKTIGNPPYGESFFGSPTGRCSDGRLVIDFMTDAMGQGFLPPYLKVGNLSLSDRSKGVNFAVAGATASDAVRLQLQYQIPSLTPLSLGKQVEWFKQLKASSPCNVTLNSSISCGDCHFTNSLYVIGTIGLNDYLGGLFYANKSVEFVQSLVPMVIGEVKNAMDVLMMEISGPKYLTVQGMPAFGCFPSVLSLTNSSSASDYDNNGCLTEVNKVALSHNSMLRSYLEDLQQRFPGTIIEYQDYYEFFMKEVSHNRFSLKACCGSGGGSYNYDSNGVCGTQQMNTSTVTRQFTTCTDPSSYFSWDGVHLTEAANKAAFDFFFSSS